MTTNSAAQEALQKSEVRSEVRLPTALQIALRRTTGRDSRSGRPHFTRTSALKCGCAPPLKGAHFALRSSERDEEQEMTETQTGWRRWVASETAPVYEALGRLVPSVLEDTPAEHAERWAIDEEDHGGSYLIGVPDHGGRAALVALVEAARATCGVDYAKAERLAELALVELRELQGGG